MFGKMEDPLNSLADLKQVLLLNKPETTITNPCSALASSTVEDSVSAESQFVRVSLQQTKNREAKLECWWLTILVCLCLLLPFVLITVYRAIENGVQRTTNDLATLTCLVFWILAFIELRICFKLLKYRTRALGANGQRVAPMHAQPGQRRGLSQRLCCRCLFFLICLISLFFTYHLKMHLDHVPLICPKGDKKFLERIDESQISGLT